MSGGTFVGAETTLYDNTSLPWLASSQFRRKLHGVTLRAASFSADGNGNKIVKSGTVVGKRSADDLYEEVVAAIAATKSTGEAASDNLLVWTARVAGTAGNSILLEIVNDQDSLSETQVEYDAHLGKITVHLKNDGTDPTALASEVIAAIAVASVKASGNLGSGDAQIKVTRREAGYLGNKATVQLINAGPSESLAVDVVDGYRLQVTLATDATSAAVAASKTLWDGVENKELVITADEAGVGGNDLSIELLNQGPDQSLAVSYDDGVISVVLETDSTDAAAPASKTFYSGVTNKELVVAANVAGAGGNDLSIEMLDPSGNDKPLSIDFDDGKITVNLATGEAGAITSTAKDVADAINADYEAKALVTASYDGTGLEVVDAQSEASLANGSDAGTGTIVSTVAEVAAAINADVECKALVTATYDGTGAEAAEAVAEAALTGGSAEGSGTITSIGTEVVAAINADPEAKALFYAEVGAAGDGSGTCAAVAETALTGGQDGVPVSVANGTDSDGSGTMEAVAEAALADGTDLNVDAAYITAEAVELTAGDAPVGVLDEGRVREALLETTVDATIKAQLTGFTFV